MIVLVVEENVVLRVILSSNKDKSKEEKSERGDEGVVPGTPTNSHFSPLPNNLLTNLKQLITEHFCKTIIATHHTNKHNSKHNTRDNTHCPQKDISDNSTEFNLLHSLNLIENHIFNMNEDVPNSANTKISDFENTFDEDQSVLHSGQTDRREINLFHNPFMF